MAGPDPFCHTHHTAITNSASSSTIAVQITKLSNSPIGAHLFSPAILDEACSPG